MSEETSESEMSFRESLPEQLRDAPYFKKAENIEQVLADLTSAAQWQGNSLRIPGPDAGDEDTSAFRQRVMEKIPGLMVVPDLENEEELGALYNKLGRPDEVDGYKLPEVAIDPGELAQMKSLAHKSGMTNKQFSEYIAGLAEARSVALSDAKTALDADVAGLREEWGASFDVRLGEVQRFLESNKDTPAEVVEALKEGKLPSATMKWLHSLADLGSEGTEYQREAPASQTQFLTPDEAQAQLGELQRGDALFDPRHTGHQAAVKRMLELNLMIAGKPPNTDMSVGMSG